MKTVSERSPGFPDALLTSRMVDDAPLNKILLEVVVYPKRLTVDDFDWILDLYETVCPRDRFKLFKITELPFWSQVADPVLTQSARAVRRSPYSFFEAARKRISEGRALEAQLWDGCEIDDPRGTFNLNIEALKRRKQGLAWYVRFLFPLDFATAQLSGLLRTLVDRLDVFSGHGGPVFAFARDKKDEAFTEIYAKARRFWGIDIDMLDLTPFRMRSELKSPCWLNALGSPFRDDPGVAARTEDLRADPDITVFDQRHATVFVLGAEPDALDRNRLVKKVLVYQRMAEVIDGFILDAVGPLAGDGFISNADATDAWLHRFSLGSNWMAAPDVQ
ncbi:type VI immunity family protein [Mesorhizobium sp. WSM3860]|uniref:type VI immunity family protein n=1 Tax=Mesorhizobium sp. WSM3860 TaxID=2029403 RepID=UPI001596D73F|nr:type VI immunity family protein [Mesorhizobium sp. WSM3860]